MLNVGQLKALLENVDDSLSVSVSLTNMPPHTSENAIVRSDTITTNIGVSGVWVRGVDGFEDSFVLVGFSPSVSIRKRKRKTR